MEFITISKYPDCEISKHAIIRKKHNKRIKSQRLNDNGYYVCSFSLGQGKSKPDRVHRLLAIAFIANPENKPFINHIDGDKTNNDLNNLEWCTCLENNRHAIKLGLNNNVGEKNGKAKLTDKKVREIKILLKEGLLSQYKIAAKFGVSRSCIMNIKNRNQWKHIIIK